MQKHMNLQFFILYFFKYLSSRVIEETASIDYDENAPKFKKTRLKRNLKGIQLPPSNLEEITSNPGTLSTFISQQNPRTSLRSTHSTERAVKVNT